MNKDKIFLGLEKCSAGNGTACQTCPYIKVNDGLDTSTPMCTVVLAADALKLLESQKVEIDKMPKWISVYEKLPQFYANVWICVKDYSKGYAETQVTKGFAGSPYGELKWYNSFNDEIITGFVTHWMPITAPAAPEGDN